eukprot:1649065-Rhodomonas_salina.2
MQGGWEEGSTPALARLLGGQSCSGGIWRAGQQVSAVVSGVGLAGKAIARTKLRRRLHAEGGREGEEEDKGEEQEDERGQQQQHQHEREEEAQEQARTRTRTRTRGRTKRARCTASGRRRS